jgi:hypothetical protein
LRGLVEIKQNTQQHNSNITTTSPTPQQHHNNIRTASPTPQQHHNSITATSPTPHQTYQCSRGHVQTRDGAYLRGLVKREQNKQQHNHYSSSITHSNITNTTPNLPVLAWTCPNT